MSDGGYPNELVSGEMMDEILFEASGPMSPTLTPFVSLGVGDPADMLTEGPTTPRQAKAHDLWETFSRN